MEEGPIIVGRTPSQLRAVVQGSRVVDYTFKLLAAFTNDYGFRAFVYAFTEATEVAAELAESKKDERCLTKLSRVFKSLEEASIEDPDVQEAVGEYLGYLLVEPPFRSLPDYRQLLELVGGLTKKYGADLTFCLMAFTIAAMMSERSPLTDAQRIVCEHVLIVINEIWEKCYGVKMPPSLFGKTQRGSAD